MIPFLDLGAAYCELQPEIDAAVARILESGWYILGPEVEAFEAEWADYGRPDIEKLQDNDISRTSRVIARAPMRSCHIGACPAICDLRCSRR